MSKYIIVCELLAVLAIGVGDAKEVENLTDRPVCPDDRFYVGSPENECKNCSYLDQLLSTNYDWLQREVGEISTRIGDQQQPPNLGNSKPAVGSRGLSSARFGESNEDVLSRLIALESESEESSEFADQTNDFSGETEMQLEINEAHRSSATTIRQLAHQVARSSLMEEDLPQAIYNCKTLKNSTGCQHWSNLCVLTMYSHSDTIHHESDKQRPRSGDRLGRGQMRSWQDCPQFSSTSACNSLREWYRLEKKRDDVSNIYFDDEALTKPVAFPSYKIGQAIQLIAYRYSLDGHLLSVDQFNLNDMKRFCVGLSASNLRDRDADIKLGANVEMKCRITELEAHLSALQSTRETIFIDLFIGYSIGGAAFVKPVPILIKSLLFNDVLINRKHSRDASRWKLVRRFFFHTSLAASPSQPEVVTRTQLNPGPDKIVLVSGSTLEFRFRRHERGPALSSILLTLDHSVLSRAEITSDEALSGDNDENNSSSLIRSQVRRQVYVETVSSIRHIMIDMLSYRKDLDLLVSALGLLSCIWSLIRCYRILKSHGLVRLDINALIRFIPLCCDTLAGVLFIVSSAYNCYSFATFKLGIPSQNLAPTEELNNSSLGYIQLSLFFKLVGFTHDVYIRVNTDIFFIDWEKPKMLTTSQIVNYQMSNKTDQQTPVISTNLTPSSPGGPSQALTKGINQKISFWRPYVVINRWIQMQSMRRLNLTVQLLLLIIVVDATDVLMLASEHPNLYSFWSQINSEQINSGLVVQESHMNPRMSPAFRALILTSVYVILAGCQILYKRYFHEPLIKDVLHEFVDLCSVANVSLFSMMFPRYGYYVHGRNANGSSDCSLSEMNALLEREERDLCSMRGLAPNSDQQAFVLVLPRIVNDHYRRLLLRDDSLTGSSIWHSKQYHEQHLPNDDYQNRTTSTTTNLLRSALMFPLAQPTSSFGSERTIVEARLAKCRAINLFLTNFLDHNYKDIDYIIRERRKFENFVLDVEFDEDRTSAQASSHLSHLEVETRQNVAVFYIDKKDSFTSLILLGFEWNLIFLELILLLAIDSWISSTHSLFIAAAIVWISELLFKSTYHHLARNNLIRKALLDEKFTS